MTEKILIVDNEPEMLQVLSRIFRRKGYFVHTETSGFDAWAAIEKTMYDLIISDMAMEGIDGLELLKLVSSSDTLTPFIVITGVGTIENAVEAMKRGAFHYITKPFNNEEIELLAKRAIEYGKLIRQLRKNRSSGKNDKSPKMIVGPSRLMNNIMRQVRKISDSTASIMIMGETGTGKSLLAEYIHENSSRKDKAFLTIDCATLTETLLESELFGHVKGAFTGAVNAKRGLLEEGHGGTIFLDEICEISPNTQVKLLRAIQDGVIKPVGGNQTVKIDVRFISASSRDFEKEISKGSFREELFYRLAVIPVSIPPLRDRYEDIPELVDYFINVFSKKYKKQIAGINPEVLEVFMNSIWKGNIRELSNIVERGVLLSEDNIITTDYITQSNFTISGRDNDVIENKVMSLKKILEIAEKKAIKNTLNYTNGNRSEAAKKLGISRRTFYDKLAYYEVE